jgi:hypothetical protein
MDGRRTRTLGKDGTYRLIFLDFRADTDEARIYLAGTEIDDDVSFVARRGEAQPSCDLGPVTGGVGLRSVHQAGGVGGFGVG